MLKQCRKEPTSPSSQRFSTNQQFSSDFLGRGIIRSKIVRAWRGGIYGSFGVLLARFCAMVKRPTCFGVGVGLMMFLFSLFFLLFLFFLFVFCFLFRQPLQGFLGALTIAHKIPSFDERNFDHGPCRWGVKNRCPKWNPPRTKTVGFLVVSF